MLKYRRAVDGFRSRGDEVRAQRAGVNQGRLLLGRGTTRTPSPSSGTWSTARDCCSAPTTPPPWRSRRDLALTLARTGRLSEAKVVAQNLRDATAQVHGDDHPATADARELLARIEASLPPG